MAVWAVSQRLDSHKAYWQGGDTCVPANRSAPIQTFATQALAVVDANARQKAPTAKDIVFYVWQVS